MTLAKAILKIPGSRLSATISSSDKGNIIFEGDEDQTARMAFAIPPMVGGNMYTVSEGELSKCGDVMCLRIEDGAGLDNHVEIEFTENTVQKVSVVFDSDHSTPSSGA